MDTTCNKKIHELDQNEAGSKYLCLHTITYVSHYHEE